MEKASLLHAPLAPGLRPACAERLLEALPYARRLRLERADPLARASSLAGLALALTAAAQARGEAFAGVTELRLHDDQKPKLEGGPHFSISHTPARVACVVCVRVDVGLDLEPAPRELGLSSARKLLHWTAREATLKAAGAGLRRVADVHADLTGLTSELDGQRYVLREVLLAPGTLGHVASARPVDLDITLVALDGAEFSVALERVLGLAAQRPQ